MLLVLAVAEQQEGAPAAFGRQARLEFGRRGAMEHAKDPGAAYSRARVPGKGYFLYGGRAKPMIGNAPTVARSSRRATMPPSFWLPSPALVLPP